MTDNVSKLRRSLFAAAGAVLISAATLSAAVMPTLAPLTAQPAL